MKIDHVQDVLAYEFPTEKHNFHPQQNFDPSDPQSFSSDVGNGAPVGGKGEVPMLKKLMHNIENNEQLRNVHIRQKFQLDSI